MSFCYRLEAIPDMVFSTLNIGRPMTVIVGDKVYKGRLDCFHGKYFLVTDTIKIPLR